MGPLLILRRLAIVALLLTALPACRKDCRNEIRLELSAPQNAYFSSLPTQGTSGSNDGHVVLARSSTGLTDSYTNVHVRQDGTAPQPTQRGCDQYFSTGRTVSYRPSLYHRSFQLSVMPYPDGPVVIMQEYAGSFGTESAESQLFYELDPQRPSYVLYYERGRTSFQRFEETPEVQILPNLNVAGRPYFGVVRITNPYTARYGSATQATVYYLHAIHGLLRFEQRNGTVWDLTP